MCNSSNSPVYCKTTEMRASILALSLFCLLFSSSESLNDYINSQDFQCVELLCYARTGSLLKRNCASHSINKAYWEQAGSPPADPFNDPDDPDKEFTKCMHNFDCIIATILQYTSSFGKIDCNCDGRFDCKDRFAIHLFGKNCKNPKFNSVYAARFNEFYQMTDVIDKMLSSEGSKRCTAPKIY